MCELYRESAAVGCYVGGAARGTTSARSCCRSFSIYCKSLSLNFFFRVLLAPPWIAEAGAPPPQTQTNAHCYKLLSRLSAGVG